MPTVDASSGKILVNRRLQSVIDGAMTLCFWMTRPKCEAWRSVLVWTLCMDTFLHQQQIRPVECVKSLLRWMACIVGLVPGLVRLVLLLDAGRRFEEIQSAIGNEQALRRGAPRKLCPKHLSVVEG